MMRGPLCAVAAVALAAAGCGNAPRYDASDVERAFRAHGLELQRLPSRGAEQPAMGETSACATRFAAATANGTVAVSVCEDADAVGPLPGYHLVRQNVVVEYSGRDEHTRARIVASLEDLG